MNTLIYVNDKEDEVVQFYFGYSISGVFARRREDGLWDVREVMYQPQAWSLGPGLWYAGAPDLYHPISGERLVAVRGSNSSRAIVAAESPAAALAAFEAALQE